MIFHTIGNIFNSEAEVLVNPVNCIGVMGKGLALQFDKEYPKESAVYKEAAKKGEIKLGVPFWVWTKKIIGVKHIVHFPTKDHWRDSSKLVDVIAGLEKLKYDMITAFSGSQSIAIPPLGCGLGGLDWKEVKAVMEDTFSDLRNIKVFIYNP